MYLFELIMPFTIRATLIQIREDILVVAAITHGQGALIIGASVKHGAVADSAGRGLWTVFPMTQLAGEFCMRMSVSLH